MKHGTKPGPRPYLNDQEERALADHLIEAAKIGYGKTRKEVKSIVERVAEEKHCLRGTQVTDGSFKVVGGTPCSSATLFMDIVPSLAASMAATIDESLHCFRFPPARRRRGFVA